MKAVTKVIKEKNLIGWPPGSDRHHHDGHYEKSGGNTMTALLLAEGANGAGGMGVVGMIIYVVVIMALMYFIAIRPQKKQQKEQQAMIASMEIGDSIMTTGGFYGVIIDITDDVVIVEFGSNKNCRIPMEKAAVAKVEKANA